MSRLRRLSYRFVSLGILMLSTVWALAADGAHRAIVSRVPPQYPELARRMHVSGTVVVQLTIQPDGSVSDAKVLSGHALLGPAAQQAVKRWKFEPSSDTSDMTIDITFNEAH